MFNMTQIDGRIQKNLFKRIQLLNRKSNVEILDPVDTDFTSLLNDVFSRTCWARVISAVPDTNKAGNDGDVQHEVNLFRLSSAFNYNPEEGSYTVKNEPLSMINGSDSEGGIYRQHSGITSINTEFLNHSIQNITINWKFYDRDQFDQYKTALLTHGRSVLIEFGWGSPIQLDSHEQTNTPETMLEYFETLNEKILNRGGDYYAAAGIITGYNWNITDGGGFECTTTIASMGATLFKSPIDKTLDTMYVDVSSQVRAKTLESAYNRANLTFGAFMAQLNHTINIVNPSEKSEVEDPDNVALQRSMGTPAAGIGNALDDESNPVREDLIKKLRSQRGGLHWTWRPKFIRLQANVADNEGYSGDDFVKFLLDNHTNRDIFPRKMKWHVSKELSFGYKIWLESQK